MAYKMEFEIQDEKGLISSSTVYVPTGQSLAAYSSFAQDWVDAALPLVWGIIRGAKICLHVPISSIDQTGKPAENSDVEEVGEYKFRSAAGFDTVLNVPAIDEDDVMPASDAMNEADANVAQLIASMINGVTLSDTVTVVQPCDAGGSDITSLRSARERFRNSGTYRR